MYIFDISDVTGVAEDIKISCFPGRAKSHRNAETHQ